MPNWLPSRDTLCIRRDGQSIADDDRLIVERGTKYVPVRPWEPWAPRNLGNGKVVTFRGDVPPPEVQRRVADAVAAARADKRLLQIRRRLGLPREHAKALLALEESVQSCGQSPRWLVPPKQVVLSAVTIELWRRAYRSLASSYGDASRKTFKRASERLEVQGICRNA